ncbi:hypothetical protein OV450_7747 [Actinobacteria bacterium OV450]|nr:hypothetical protein OV450_7747 [Actinobacteria bacterium OV450]
MVLVDALLAAAFRPHAPAPAEDRASQAPAGPAPADGGPDAARRVGRIRDPRSGNPPGLEPITPSVHSGTRRRTSRRTRRGPFLAACTAKKMRQARNRKRPGLKRKRSRLTEAQGIPLVTEPAPANIHDHTLLPVTLDAYCDLGKALGPLPEHPRLDWTPATTTAPSTMTWPNAHRRTDHPTRSESPDSNRRPAGRRAHEFLDEQLRQTPPLQRALCAMSWPPKLSLGS